MKQETVIQRKISKEELKEERRQLNQKERSMRWRLRLKYTLILFAMFLAGGVTVLFTLALINNYIAGNHTITTLFTEDIYAVLVMLVSILILFLLFRLFVIELAFNDARDDGRDSLVRVKETHRGTRRVLHTTSPIYSAPTNEKASYELAHQLQMTPGAITVTEEEATTRFPTLTYIDDTNPELKRVQCDPELTLASICDNFREYAAGELHLYYSIRDIRSFIASLCCSKILLLQGMSGTGKTSLPVAFGKFISNTTPVVPVQPTWKERSDLLGYYNEFTGKFSETPLLTSLYKAGTSDSIQLIVLDEVNIARIEYYFAEFLSLLELPDQNARILQVASSGMEKDPKRMSNGAILLPENVWFIGTANNDDSTFSISDKVYDRAAVLDLDTRAEPFRATGFKKENISIQRLNRLNAEAQRRYALTERDLRKIDRMDEYLRGAFRVSFGNRIMRQIKMFVPVFVACGGSSSEALDVILAKKVLRKLSSCNPVLVKARSQELISLMVSLFGEENCKECVTAIKRIAENG